MIVNDQSKFRGVCHRDCNFSRWIVFVNDAAVEDLSIVHVNLKNHTADVSAALPLNADLTLKSRVLFIESDHDFTVGMSAQAVLVRLIFDPKLCGIFARRLHSGIVP